MTETTFADGGTRIVTRNADGMLAFITGTTVTPEYHTYGVEVIVVGGNTVGRGVLTVSRCWGRALSCELIPIFRSRLSCSRK